MSAKKKILIACAGAVVLAVVAYFSIKATRKDQVAVQSSKVQKKELLKSKVSSSGEIRVLSNDPDSPEQMIKLSANGTGMGGGDSKDPSVTESAGEDGCGCRAAGTSSTIPSWAGFGLLGLGAALALQRSRRRQHRMS